MTPKKKNTKKIFLELFENSMGNISFACKGSNISRQTYYNWVDNDQDFADQVSNVNESLLDFAESKLAERIKSGHTAELIFFLKTKGKKRGYSETIQIREEKLPQGFNVHEI